MSGIVKLAKALGVKLAPQDEALRVAQENAVKMLGLPPGNTPAQRADAIGKMMDVYHGSPSKDIVEFSAGMRPVFTSPVPEYAAEYANKGQAKKGGLYELKMRTSGVFDTNNPEHLSIYNQEFLPKVNARLQKSGKPASPELVAGENVSFVDADQFYRFLKSQMAEGRKLPFDVVPVKEGVSSLYGKSADTSYFPLEPAQLRLKNAAFDPARINENNLLASRLLPFALPGLLSLPMGDNE